MTSPEATSPSAAKCQVPWGACRKLLESLRQRAESDPGWGSHKGLISLAVPDLEPELTPQERAERHRFDALRLAFRPGVALNLRPLQEAWADTLVEALQGGSLHLRIPDISLWDFESVSVLRPLLGRLGASRLCLEIGEDTGPADKAMKREVELLRAAISLFGSETGEAPALELEGAWPTPLTIRETFSAYGFLTALAQARRMLAEGCDHPAEIHALAALSIHHHDQFGLSDPEVGQEFAEHMKAWLADEEDPLRRSTGHYYLGLYHGRSRREPAVGLEHAERALKEAGDSAYHQAWALNCRAYQKAKLGRFEQACADCSQALELKQEQPEPKLWWHLSGNLCQVCSGTGDLDAAREWSQKQARFELDVPSSLLPPVWNYAFQDRRDLADTAQRGRGRLEMAMARMDLPGIALVSQILADLTYRLGLAGEAHQHFQRARRIGAVLGEDADDLFTTSLNEAKAAMRAEKWEAADELLAEFLQGPYAQDEDARLEFEVWRAHVLARRGEYDAALKLTGQALGAAQSNPGLLLRLAPRAAEVCRVCGAHEFCSQILEAVRPLAGDSRAPGEDAFVALAAQPTLTPEEAALALALAPEALDDPDCWWSLEPLLLSLRPHTQHLGEGLDSVVSAAEQRVSLASVE